MDIALPEEFSAEKDLASEFLEITAGLRDECFLYADCPPIHYPMQPLNHLTLKELVDDARLELQLFQTFQNEIYFSARGDLCAHDRTTRPPGSFTITKALLEVLQHSGPLNRSEIASLLSTNASKICTPLRILTAIGIVSASGYSARYATYTYNYENHFILYHLEECIGRWQAMVRLRQALTARYNELVQECKAELGIGGHVDCIDLYAGSYKHDLL